MEARRGLIEALGDRYRKSERAEKKKILDEFVELAGYHRKHAIRVLRSERRIKVPAPGMASRVYDEAVITALTIIWEAADRICGKRLKAVLTTFVESMERSSHPLDFKTTWCADLAFGSIILWKPPSRISSKKPGNTVISSSVQMPQTAPGLSRVSACNRFCAYIALL